MGVLNDKLYVLGGTSNLGLTALKTMEAYDPATEKWSDCASMLNGREGPAVFVHSGKLYAVGGSGLTSVEIYDPSSNAWSAGPAMRVGRKDLGAALIGNVAYAVGGDAAMGSTALASTEVLSLGSPSNSTGTRDMTTHPRPLHLLSARRPSKAAE